MQRKIRQQQKETTKRTAEMSEVFFFDLISEFALLFVPFGCRGNVTRDLSPFVNPGIQSEQSDILTHSQTSCRLCQCKLARPAGCNVN